MSLGPVDPGRQRLAGLALLLFVVGATYAVLVLSGRSLGQGMRFERPWAGVLALGALLVVWSRGYWDKTHAPRVQVSRGFQPNVARSFVASMAYRKSWPGRSATNLICSQ